MSIADHLMEEGRVQGFLIGSIQMIQRDHGLPVTDMNNLLAHDIPTLQKIYADLEPLFEVNRLGSMGASHQQG